MICKSCGATVKEGQFTCSSCGAYLSKDSTVQSASLRERSDMNNGPSVYSGNDSGLYTSNVPVVVKDGWKWYAFMTWGMIPLFSVGAIFEIPSYFKISALLGFLYIVYIILGWVAHVSLREFEEKGIKILYTFLAMPIIMLFLECMILVGKFREIYGQRIDTSIVLWDVMKEPRIVMTMIVYIVFLVVNVVYFNNRKDEFGF